MGQTQKNIIKQQVLSHSIQYPFDVRLLQQMTELPTCLSSNTQKIIQDLDDIMNQIQKHQLEQYLIYSIDMRFSRYNRVNKQNLLGGSIISQALEVDQSKFEHKEWIELSSKQIFLQTLTSFQHQYEVQLLIQQQFLKQGHSDPSLIGYQTLRKPIVAQSSKINIQMDEGLIMRLLYHYYMVMIKTYANSGDKNVFKFHQETGKQLCLMILHGYLRLQELFELFYLMVYIDKHPKQLSTKLGIINRLYHQQCLKTCYTINIEPRKLQSLKTTTRLFLDQLYMNSIREAQDPQIRITDDTLNPIKVFPISRVKDRPRP